jgi:hypothetical protein
METRRGRNAPQSDRRRVLLPGVNYDRHLLANAQVRKAARTRAGGCGVGGAQKFEAARASRRSPRWARTRYPQLRDR